MYIFAICLDCLIGIGLKVFANVGLQLVWCENKAEGQLRIVKVKRKIIRNFGLVKRKTEKSKFSSYKK